MLLEQRYKNKSLFFTGTQLYQIIFYWSIKIVLLSNTENWNHYTTQQSSKQFVSFKYYLKSNTASTKAILSAAWPSFANKWVEFIAVLGAVTLLQTPASYIATDFVPITSIGYDVSVVEEDPTICCKKYDIKCTAYFIYFHTTQLLAAVSNLTQVPSGSKYSIALNCEASFIQFASVSTAASLTNRPCNFFLSFLDIH